MAQLIPNESVIKCLHGPCNALPKIVCEFTNGHDKLVIFVCGKHRNDAIAYVNRSQFKGWELNIRNWPFWLKELQEIELAKINEGQHVAGNAEKR